MPSPGSAQREMLLEGLARHTCFAELARADLEFLSARAEVHIYAADELLFLEGDPSPGMWIVSTGRVKIYKISPDGREQILRFVEPGGSFNEVTLFESEASPANAAALAPSMLWVLPRQAVRDLLLQYPDLALAMLGHMAANMRHLIREIEELAFYPVTVRLARFLTDSTDSPTAPSDVTRAAIAARLSTTPETISRALRALQEMGAIRVDRQQITVLKHDMLHTIAEMLQS